MSKNTWKEYILNVAIKKLIKKNWFVLIMEKLGGTEKYGE